MAKEKNLASRSQTDVLDIADKNREKINFFQTFVSIILMVLDTLTMKDGRNI